jgi:hypothetical protein
MLWKTKASNTPNGKSNKKSPPSVWLQLLLTLILKKYSKSGVKLPTTSPVNETHRLGRKAAGKTIAGCENVNGIEEKHQIRQFHKIGCHCTSSSCHVNCDSPATVGTPAHPTPSPDSADAPAAVGSNL